MIEASLILCDFAEQDPTGKVHMIGAGWSTTGPEPQPHSVVFFIKAPLQENPVHITLRLLDANDQVVTMPGIAGMARLEFPGQMEIKARPGAPAEADGQGAFALNVAPLPLQPGSKYSWVLEVESKEEARTTFFVRDAVVESPTPQS